MGDVITSFEKKVLRRRLSREGKAIEKRLDSIGLKLRPKSTYGALFYCMEDECLYKIQDGLHPKLNHRVEAWKNGESVEGIPDYDGQIPLICQAVGISPDDCEKRGGTVSDRDRDRYERSMAAYEQYS